VKRLTVLSLLLLPAAHAYAQSFDCAKASAAAERAICSDKSLGDLDATLAALFKDGLAAAGSDALRRSLVADERRWVAHRNATCAAPVQNGCLVKAYADRIAYLWNWANDNSPASEQIAIPADAARFVKDTQKVTQFEVGDINGDGLPDYLLVVEQPTAQVALLLLVRQPDGSLRLAGLNREIVNCDGCGGMGGSSDVTPTGSGFRVSNVVGAGMVNSGEELTFEYRSKERDWVLVKQRTWDNDSMQSPAEHKEQSRKPYEHGEVIRFEDARGRLDD
jgi:uncharacterized protein